MKQIRQGVFETNSSSTHSMTVCMENDWNKFKDGEKLIHRWDDNLVDKDDDKVKKHPQDYITYEDWCSKESELESFMETFTTPNGETILIFGRYGYDG